MATLIPKVKVKLSLCCS